MYSNIDEIYKRQAISTIYQYLNSILMGLLVSCKENGINVGMNAKYRLKCPSIDRKGNQ